MTACYVIKSINNVGPKLDPWGTQDLILKVSEK